MTEETPSAADLAKAKEGILKALKAFAQQMLGGSLDTIGEPPRDQAFIGRTNLSLTMTRKDIVGSAFGLNIANTQLIQNPYRAKAPVVDSALEELARDGLIAKKPSHTSTPAHPAFFYSITRQGIAEISDAAKYPDPAIELTQGPRKYEPKTQRGRSGRSAA
jgi:hypothetical protein